MIESPCIRHCCLDENDICLGCHRSLEEIKQWGTSSLETKRLILQKAIFRRNRHADILGKRKAS